MVGVADSNSVEPTKTHDARTLNSLRIFYCDQGWTSIFFKNLLLQYSSLESTFFKKIAVETKIDFCIYKVYTK